MIHRDLKPENIFLARRKDVSSVKLLDFGIAKLIDGIDSGRDDDTRPGVLIGTPRYISPEQVHGRTLDGRADIYALGVVAFELLAGRLPFSGSSAGAYELFEKHAKLKPPKPSAFNMQLPEAADALVGAMLAKEPGERPGLTVVRDALLQLRLAPASELAAERAAAAAQPTDVHAVPAQSALALESPTTRTERALPVEAERPSGPVPRPRWVVRAAIGSAVALAAMIAVAIATTGNPLPARTDAPVPTAPPVVAQPQLRVTPIGPSATDSATASATAAIAAAPDAGVDSDEPAIELDPVSHVPTHAAHARHPKQPASAKPPTGSDEDAVRSPFEHAP